jgi:hypothetical protein
VVAFPVVSSLSRLLSIVDTDSHIAGGYDALWVLVLDPENAGEKPSDRVEQVWASWKKLDVSPLLAEESHTGGCRLEDVEKVPGLQATTAA